MPRLLILAFAAVLSSSANAHESSSRRYTNLSVSGGEAASAGRLTSPSVAPSPDSKQPSSRPARRAAIPRLAPAFVAPAPPPPPLPARFGWGAWAILALGAAGVFALFRRDRARVRANDESLALAAHELQSPLAAIESYLDLMASETPGGTQQARGWLEDIGRMRSTTSHLRRTITDILDMTRVEDGRVKLAARPVELALLIEASVAAYAPHAAARGVALKLDVSVGLAPALADPDRLRQVLDNLIGNAIKYTPSGRSITIAARQTADSAIFEVRDEGVGVPADKRHRLFGKFQRLGPAVDGTEGTGLGLYLSQRLAAAQGGRLEHEAPAAGGSVFRVTMPRA